MDIFDLDDSDKFPFKSAARYRSWYSNSSSLDERFEFRCTEEALFRIIQKAYHDYMTKPNTIILPPKENDVR